MKRPCMENFYSTQISPEDLSILREVFSYPEITPSPTFPSSFMQFIPHVNIMELPESHVTFDMANRILRLDLFERKMILSMIEDQESIIRLSAANIQFINTLIMQSLCTLLVTQMNSFDSETYRLFLRLLMKSILTSTLKKVHICYILKKIYNNIISQKLSCELLHSICDVAKVSVKYHKYLIKEYLCILSQFYDPDITSLPGSFKAMELFVLLMKDIMINHFDKDSNDFNISNFFQKVGLYLKKEGPINWTKDVDNYKFGSFLLCVELSAKTDVGFDYIFDYFSTTAITPILEKYPQEAAEKINVPLKNVIIKKIIEGENFNIDFTPNYAIPSISALLPYMKSGINSIFDTLRLMTVEAQFYFLKYIIDHYDLLDMSVSVNYIACILSIIDKISLDSFEIIKKFFLEKIERISIFLNSYLFNPSITVFDKSDSYIINTRVLAIQLFVLFFIHEEKALDVFFHFLFEKVRYPLLFSELLIFAGNIITNLVTSRQVDTLILISRHIESQHILAYQKEIPIEARRATFGFVFNIINNIEISEMNLAKSQIGAVLLDIIFEFSFADISERLFMNIINKINQKSGKVVELFAMIIERIIYISPDYDTLKKPFDRFCHIFKECSEIISQKALQKLCQSPIAASIQEAIYDGIGCKQLNEVLSLYVIVTKANVWQNTSIEWKQVSDCIKPSSINSETVKIINQIISGSENFDQILNVNALSLVKPVLRTSMASDFLGPLVQMTIGNMVSAVILYDAGIIDILVETIKTCPNYLSPKSIKVNSSENNLTDEAISMCYRIIENVSVFACNRRNYFSIMSLIKNNQIKCLKSVLYLLSRPRTALESPIMIGHGNYLTLSKESLVQPLIGISIWLMIPQLQNQEDNLILLQYDNWTLKLSSSALSLKIVDIETKANLLSAIPFCQYTNLFIEITESSDLKLYFDGILAAQLNGIALPIHSIVQRALIPNNFMIFFHMIEFITKYNIKNMVNGGPFAKTVIDFTILRLVSSSANNGTLYDEKGRQWLPFTGAKARYIYSFEQIFKTTNGVDYIIHCFENAKTSIYIQTLLETLLTVTLLGSDTQKQISDIGAFQIISIWLEKEPQLLTEKIWNLFIYFEQQLKDTELHGQLCEYILYNYRLWKDSAENIQLTVLNKWIKDYSTNHTAIFNYVDSIHIIDILHYNHSKKTLSIELRKTLFKLIKITFLAKFNFSKFGDLFMMMNGVADDEDLLCYSLEKFRKVSLLIPGNEKLFVSTIVNVPFVINNESPKIHKTLIINYFSQLKNVIDQLLISELCSVRNRNIENNDLQLVYFINEICGLEFESLDEQKHLIKLNPEFFSYTLLLANYSSEQMKEKYSEFISQILTDSDFAPIIASRITSVGYLFLTNFLIFIRPNISTLASFCIHSPNSFCSIISILDSFEYTYMTSTWNYKSELASKMISYANRSKRWYDSLFDIIEYIFMHFPNSVDESKVFAKPIELYDFYLRYKELKVPPIPSKFTLKFRMNVWIDYTLAFDLVTLAFNYDVSKLKRLTPILAFVASNIESVPKHVLQMFNVVSAELGSGAIEASPLIHSAVKNIHKFDSATDFIRINKNEINSPLLNEIRFNEYMDMYQKTFQGNAAAVTMYSSMNDLLITQNYSDIKYESKLTEPTDSLTKAQNKLILFDRKIQNSHSPLFRDIFDYSKICYERSSRLDGIFRPILITPQHSMDLLPEALKASSDPGTVSWQAPCIRYNKFQQTPGKFVISDKYHLFYGENGAIKSIRNNLIKYILPTWIDRRPNGITIITCDNRHFTFCFPEESGYKLIEKFRKQHLQNIALIGYKQPSEEVKVLGLTERWMNGGMSNFHYLMWLNLLSGRSFNVPSAYPIFPVLELSGNKLRDFEMHISAQTESNRKELDKELEERIRNGEGRFYHQSYISNQDIVSSFLYRLKPFDESNPTRIFKSYEEEFSTGKIIDCELIPEFFFLEEFLLDKYDVADGDVSIPMKAFEWITHNRDFLESDEVSDLLPNWIDIIWGVKRHKNAAKKCYNTYDPDISTKAWDNYYLQTTESGPTDVYTSLSDIFDDSVLELGQIPQELFSLPHPKKQVVLRAPFSFIVSYQFIAFRSIGADPVSICVYGVTANGNFVKVENGGKVSEPVHIAEKFKKDTPLAFSRLIVAYASENQLFVYDVKDCKVIRSNVSLHVNTIKTISLSNTLIVSGGVDSTIVIWSYKGKKLRPIGTLFAHSSPICYTVLDHFFNINVSLDLSGYLSISFAPSLSFIRGFNVEFEKGTPWMAVVSHERGIITAAARDTSYTYLKSFTINGTQIAEARINLIDDMCAASDARGGDWIVCVAKGEVTKICANTLSRQTPIYKGATKALAVQPLPKPKMAAVCFDSGDVFFTPL